MGTTEKTRKPTPVIEFEDLKHAEWLLDWWVERLQLQAWLIDIVLVSREEMADIADGAAAGHTRYSISVQEACIFITVGDDESPASIRKHCHEQTLVHELLHLKLHFTSITGTSLGDKMLDVVEHQNVESLAKALIMVKYDLPIGWFHNKTGTKKEKARSEN